MKKLLCLGFISLLLIVGCQPETVCEYDEYNSITKVQANEIIELTNGVIRLFNACSMATGMYENETIEQLQYFIIP